jgi:2-aminoadipate transaminase
VTLPEGLNASDLLARAIERQLAFVPGADFHANGGGQNTLRLNFSHPTPEQIQEGIRRLANVIGQAAP